MTKSVKRLVIIIGLLSVVSGVYLAVSGSEFSEYIFGIIIGVSLIGSAFYYKENE